MAVEVVQLRRRRRTLSRDALRRLAGWLAMPALLAATATVLVLAVRPRTLAGATSRIDPMALLLALG